MGEAARQGKVVEVKRAYDGPRWYIVATNNGQERLAAFHLRRLGHEVYLPLRLVNTTRGPSAHAFFPGYLMLRLGLGAEWWDVFHAIGVKTMIGGQDRPAYLRQDIVSQIKEREIDGFLKLEKLDLESARPCIHKPGDKVKVAVGEQFGEVDAIFLERIDSERCRLIFKLLQTDLQSVVALGRVRSDPAPSAERT